MSGEREDSGRLEFLSDVQEASRVIAPLWPLSRYVAVNPLWDLRHMGFEEATACAGEYLGISGYPATSFFDEALTHGRITLEDLQSALSQEESGKGLAPGGEAARLASSLCDSRRDTQKTDSSALVDREVAKWCAAYVAGVVPDECEQGFYLAWQKCVKYDLAARRAFGKDGRMRLANYGDSAEDAAQSCLGVLDVPADGRVQELARQLAHMPGWAGHAKWRSQWAQPSDPGPHLHLIDYLAVRLCYEAAYRSSGMSRKAMSPRDSGLPQGLGAGRVRTAAMRQDGHSRPEGLPSDSLIADAGALLGELGSAEQRRIWLAAYENHYRDRLLSALRSSKDTPAPRAQAVFCIDTRSERLRRHLEAAGPYETFGFAGFFGLPMRYRAWRSREAVDLCPVFVQPTCEITEQPTLQSSDVAVRAFDVRQGTSDAQVAFGSTRKGAVSQFVFAEAMGFVLGPIAVAKTLAPSGFKRAQGRMRRLFAPSFDAVISDELLANAMSDAEQAQYGFTTLTTMGLAHNFARIVLLCGHGSTSVNNPYASSLDCGACGGSRGGPSARVAAAILNRPVVRELLAARGMAIPQSTLFIAGEHETVNDSVAVLDDHLVPSSHRDEVAQLQAALTLAGRAAAMERRDSLPDPEHSPIGRGADWAQIRPEWGLARNAALIIAPRSATAGVDLEGRVFLHSYDAAGDPDGTVLESILLGPMIVAHWINAQYYFSTVDPDVLSAGDKTVHNIVAGIGVLEGAGGDLKVGLPLQSVYDGKTAYHEPMRLLVVVQGPVDRLEEVIARQQVVRELFEGHWVNVVARENLQGVWKIRSAGGNWANLGRS